MEAKVVGQGGLFLREDSSQKFSKVTFIPEFEKVTLLSEGPYDLICGISDRWYRARYLDNDRGICKSTQKDFIGSKRI
jgi:hypothetical protein